MPASGPDDDSGSPWFRRHRTLNGSANHDSDATTRCHHALPFPLKRWLRHSSRHPSRIVVVVVVDHHYTSTHTSWRVVSRAMRLPRLARHPKRPEGLHKSQAPNNRALPASSRGRQARLRRVLLQPEKHLHSTQLSRSKSQAPIQRLFQAVYLRHLQAHTQH